MSDECDCVNCVGAAPILSSEIRVEQGAACECFPANDECPSAARCTKGSGRNLGLGAGDPKVAWERWEDVRAEGHEGYLRLLNELKTLHVFKSGGYGTGPDPFANFTQVAVASGQPRYLYPVLRSIEKLTRVLSLHAQGRVGELDEELLDVASLNLCAAAMLRDDD